MKFELHHLSLPLRSAFETSFARETTKDCLLVCVEHDGLRGWGEVPVMAQPLYNEETLVTARHVLADFLIPLTRERRLHDPRDFARAARRYRRHNMAKAGLEAALWDLKARREGRPLSELLGGTRAHVEVGVSVGIEADVAGVLGSVESFRAAGYRRIKLKIKPGFDLEPARQVRRLIGDDPLQLDANSAYRLSDRSRLEPLDELGLLMLEQPFDEDDLVDHATLARGLKTPICLDESITSPEQARQALQLQACRIINIKPARIGGLTAALAVHELCRAAGIPVWCGGLLETGVGRLQLLALASLPGFTLPGDISASERYFERDIIDPPVVLEEGSRISVPTCCGTEERLDLEALERFTTGVERL